MSEETKNREGMNFWDSYSKDFALIYGNRRGIVNGLVNHLFRKGMKLRFEATIERIPENATGVLDMGCGPGIYLRALEAKGVTNLIGVDYSEGMLEVAKSGLDEAKGTRLLHSDIFELSPDSSNQVQYAIMMGFIEYFEDPLAVIGHIAEFGPEKIFISFPAANGLLALQRRLRYRNKCFLRMYEEHEIVDLAMQIPGYECSIERMSRDYFVTFFKAS